MFVGLINRGLRPPLEITMSKGWVVVKFENNKAENVFFSWEKFEAQEKAEELNVTR